MIAIHAQTERKRLDRSVRCAEKRRPWARKQRLRGLIRPDPAVCATAGAACGRKSLSSARIQAIFTSNDTPLGECRYKTICVKSTVHYRAAFDPIASEMRSVASPGVFACDLRNADYQNLPSGKRAEAYNH
nr:MlrC C-terminal domain-containing protein [Phaeobacter piscinae]